MKRAGAPCGLGRTTARGVKMERMGESSTGKPGPPARSLKTMASHIGHGIRAFVAESPENRHKAIDDSPIFDAPLVAVADGDDPLFAQYKTIIGDFHMTPREVLAQESSAAAAADTVSVICWILPVARKARLSNRRRELTPSLRWAHTRLYGERFNDLLREHVVSRLTRRGCAAVAPMLTSGFKSVEHDDGPASTWSERHAAYVAGLGTFSLSDGFITPSGIAMRCGSAVTDLPLPASERACANHLSNCRHYRDGSCGACIDRCPAGAITAMGHDKNKCRTYMRDGLQGLPERYGTEDIGYAGCGLCQTGVPCEWRIPPPNA